MESCDWTDLINDKMQIDPGIGNSSIHKKSTEKNSKQIRVNYVYLLKLNLKKKNLMSTFILKFIKQDHSLITLNIQHEAHF